MIAIKKLASASVVSGGDMSPHVMLLESITAENRACASRKLAFSSKIIIQDYK
jgi:hypothetical protein